MASVRKRKWTHNGIAHEAWVVEYTDQSGKRRRFTPKSGLKKDADKERLRVEIEVEGGVHTPDSASITIAEAAESFVADLSLRHEIGETSGYTLKNRITGSKIIKARFGSTLVKDLTSGAVEEWVMDLAKKYKRDTIACRYMVLFMILKHSVKRKWVKRNVLADDPVKIPKGQGSRAVNVPTRDDLHALLLAVEAKETMKQYPRSYLWRRAAVMLGIFAGLRRGEMLGLQWENIDFANNMILVRNSFSEVDGLRGPKTAAGVRDIPMAPAVRAALVSLQEYWRARERVARRGAVEGVTDPDVLRHRLQSQLKRTSPEPDDTPLSGYVLRGNEVGDFRGGKPIRPNAFSGKHWNRIMAAAGLVDRNGKHKFSVHAMRHAAASLFIESGLPAFNLKTLIGHASVTTTYDIYGHLFPDDDRSRRAIEGIAADFGATRERQETARH